MVGRAFLNVRCGSRAWYLQVYNRPHSRTQEWRSIGEPPSSSCLPWFCCKVRSACLPACLGAWLLRIRPTAPCHALPPHTHSHMMHDARHLLIATPEGAQAATPPGGSYAVTRTNGPSNHFDVSWADSQYCTGQLIYNVVNHNSFTVNPTVPGPWTVQLAAGLSLADPKSWGYSTSAGKSGCLLTP